MEPHFAHHNPMDFGLEQTKNKQCQKKGMKGNWIQHILKVLPQQTGIFKQCYNEVENNECKGCTRQLHKLKRRGKLSSN